ncbi:molybdopterin-binding protein [Clostridium estertheticum]|uniref:molybdopterin-binding protein n=1 Tax=Clostridium estertheticum TaxID=238834 RepID=UPI001C7DBCA4|nr:molybdopterin-binding protein [Clostridium estertheticum]MBX4267666.1 molybdopterin-binding protein [Clostridium estertheticum]WLC77918.1 molybdopterin-binding protein [Clostridium estertheticum]
MKIVPVEEALGMVLCHDLTKIVPGEFHGVAFKKGHVISEEDIPKMLDIGKKNIYVWEMQEGMIHENEAGERMARAAAGKGIIFTKPSEGKVKLVAECKGLLKINIKALEKINMIDEAMVATLHTDIVVDEGSVIAGTRIIPLFIEDYKIEQIENICKEEGPIIWVETLRNMKVGIVTTGSEVYSGRISDKFGPVIKNKINEIGSQVIKQIIVTDSENMIADAINELLTLGVEMIVVTGGMSVDPDDVTPAGIRKAGAKVISYGAPVLPGAMFLVAYMGDIPVLGLPGCVMYNERTVFDLILPKILAGEMIKRGDITKLGHGGLCVKCEVCDFPACSFGKC